jgi:hypothetical protein
MKKCRFEVDVSYDEYFFAEGEIKETLRKSIRDLGELKVNNYGKEEFMKSENWIMGIHANVEKTESDEPKLEFSDEHIAELLAISGVFEEDIPDKDVPKLSEEKMEILLAHVKKAFAKKS